MFETFQTRIAEKAKKKKKKQRFGQILRSF